MYIIIAARKRCNTLSFFTLFNPFHHGLYDNLCTGWRDMFDWSPASKVHETGKTINGSSTVKGHLGTLWQKGM